MNDELYNIMYVCKITTKKKSIFETYIRIIQ